MKLQLTLGPTEHFFTTDEGIPVRAWVGHTNHGTPVTALIAALTRRNRRAGSGARLFALVNLAMAVWRFRKPLMKLQLTLEPTEHFFTTDEGVPVRAWTGHTNRGMSVTAFIAALAAEDGRGEELAERKPFRPLEIATHSGDHFVVERRPRS